MSRRGWVAIVILLVVMVAALGAVLILQPWEGEPSAKASKPTPTNTSASVEVSDATLSDLSGRLTSRDPAVLAQALGLDPAAVPAEVQTIFPTLRIAFDAEATQQRQGVWIVPATVTEANGTQSEWIVTIADVGGSLVFVDSEPDGSVN